MFLPRFVCRNLFDQKQTKGTVTDRKSVANSSTETQRFSHAASTSTSTDRFSDITQVILANETYNNVDFRARKQLR